MFFVHPQNEGFGRLTMVEDFLMMDSDLDHKLFALTLNFQLRHQNTHSLEDLEHQRDYKLIMDYQK